MFARVLFPTDFSPQADQLAGCLNEMKPLGMEEVVLLNVVELGPQIGFASDTFEQMLAWKKDAEPRLADLKNRIENERHSLPLASRIGQAFVGDCSRRGRRARCVDRYGNSWARLCSRHSSRQRHARCRAPRVCSCPGPKGHGDGQVGEHRLRLCMPAHVPASSASDRLLRMRGRGARIG